MSAGLVMGLTMIPSPTVAADGPVALSIAPASQGSGIKRTFFAFSMAPGTVQEDAVVVTNSGDAVANVRVYVANAFSTPSGGVGVKSYSTEIEEPATWLHYTSQLGDGVLQIPGHTAKRIPFAIRVPADAGPGDYAFGLAAMPAIDQPNIVPGQDTVTIVAAVATRALVRVDGPLVPSVAITDMQVTANPAVVPGTSGGGSTVAFNLVNSGNQQLKATVNISQINALGRISYRYPSFTIKTLLPGSSIPIKRGWPDAPILRGRIRVDITTDADAAVSRTMGFWSVPWNFIVIVAVAVLLLSVLVRFRRRRRRSTDRSASGGSPSVRKG